jgi:hypothetical protein
VVGSGRADGAVVPDLNDKKGDNHETYDNRTSKCFCSLEHGRHGASHDRRIIRCDPGTSRDCRIWISRGSVGGVVRVAVGRLDKCRPHMEQHWPRSASAQCAYTSVTPPGTPLPRSACHATLKCRDRPSWRGLDGGRAARRQHGHLVSRSLALLDPRRHLRKLGFVLDRRQPAADTVERVAYSADAGCRGRSVERRP